MKSSIDNKEPRMASHLKTKAKKNALVEDRLKQIETENRLLLEKMSHIMRVSRTTHDILASCFDNYSWLVTFVGLDSAREALITRIRVANTGDL